MSKITVAGVRTNVQSLLAYSLDEKKRNFLYVTPSVGPLGSITGTCTVTKANICP